MSGLHEISDEQRRDGDRAILLPKRWPRCRRREDVAMVAGRKNEVVG